MWEDGHEWLVRSGGGRRDGPGRGRLLVLEQNASAAGARQLTNVAARNSICSASGWKPSSSNWLATAASRAGLRWSDCSFDDEVTYARHRQGGELLHFVAVTIAFEAIEGGGMEEVEAVSNLRAATAVFRLDHGKWQTDGRAIFNLNPTEAIAYYQDNLVLVGQE